jgi:hypothetical protein
VLSRIAENEKIANCSNMCKDGEEISQLDKDERKLFLKGFGCG